MKKHFIFVCAIFLSPLFGHAQIGIHFRPGLTAQKRFVNVNQTQISEAVKVNEQFGMGISYLLYQGDLLELEFMGSSRNFSIPQTSIPNLNVRGGSRQIFGLRLAYGLPFATSDLGGGLKGRHYAMCGLETQRQDFRSPDAVRNVPIVFNSIYYVEKGEVGYSRELSLNFGYRFVGEISRHFSLFVGAQAAGLHYSDVVWRSNSDTPQRDRRMQFVSRAGIEAGVAFRPQR